MRGKMKIMAEERKREYQEINLNAFSSVLKE